MRLQTCVLIFMGFCQEENDIANMCTNVMVFSGGE